MRIVTRNFYRKSRMLLVVSAFSVCFIIIVRTGWTTNWSNITASMSSAHSSSAKPWEWSKENLHQFMSLLDRQHRQQTINGSDTNFTRLANVSHLNRLQFPSLARYLPFIIEENAALMPAYLMSKRQPNKKASIVFGVPHIRRSRESYLQPTLHFLLNNLRPEDIEDTLIIVFIAETNIEYVMNMTNTIANRFRSFIDLGVLEVLSPSQHYYPDFNSTFTKHTLGDELKRVHWRTKQNLDFAYLMMYSYTKGEYYVQLEDDVVSKPNYVAEIKQCITDLRNNNTDWLTVRFCRLGFIGQMLKCSDLPQLITFLLVFHSDQPSDWLLDYLIQVRACRKDKDVKHCRKAKDEIWRTYSTSLFQHIGYHSSLDGKVQKLKDKFFKTKEYTFFTHKHNPKAVVTTTLQSYKQHTIRKAYDGDDYFWSLNPQTGDNITITFRSNNVSLDYALFQSGNIDHPSDLIPDGTTVEVMPIRDHNNSNSGNNNNNNNVSPINSDFAKTNDNYYIITYFNDGYAKANNFSQFNPIKEIRITINSDSKYWIILSEIHIKTI